MKRLFLLFSLSGISLTGMFCTGENRGRAVNEYLKHISTDQLVANLKRDFRDSLNSWIEKGLDYVLFLKKTNWKVDDMVFFNKSRNRALLLLLVQVDDPYSPIDYVKVIGAEKLNSSWQFYYVSYVVMEFSRSQNSNALSFESLAHNGRKNLCDDGFIKCGFSCKVNYHYLDTDIWFADWVRASHQKFLRNELPKNPIDKNHRFMY